MNCQEIPPLRLTGQVAVITGGGRGIGRAIALAVAAAGAQVTVLSRSTNELAAAVDLIEQVGGNARALPVDVTDASAIANAFVQIGTVDLLVNNAGSLGPVGPLSENDPVDWWRTLEVNLRGPVLCTKAVLPMMIARRRGRIVNVSSGAAAMSIENFSAYVTSKAALNKFTECLALETKGHGIAVFAVSPGPVRTAMSEALLNSAEGQKWLPWFRPMFDQHSVPPERAAELVVTLASGASDERSGQFISVT